ncbi:hypothetical protein QFZ41_000278 [Luteibacter sp. W1I16]|uniref:hypothetical protein n=1 Tax=Luteibacter sp. W1I16 TaxID=3373922 RepID=UPI003D1AE0C2
MPVPRAGASLAEGGARHYIDPEASAHDLRNDATEWLQCGRGLTGLLAGLVHESDTVDCAQLALRWKRLEH